MCGFGSETDILKIAIWAEQKENGCTLYVQDNGKGFSPETLSELNKKIKNAESESKISQPGFEIGGMGIINTYLRFRLLYGENFCFELGNYDLGAVITLQFKTFYTTEIGENNNV